MEEFEDIIEKFGFDPCVKPKSTFIDSAKYIDEPMPAEIKDKFRSLDRDSASTLEVDPEWERLASQTEGERQYARRKHFDFPTLPGTTSPPKYSNFQVEMLAKQDEIIEFLDRILDRLSDLESSRTAYDLK